MADSSGELIVVEITGIFSDTLGGESIAAKGAASGGGREQYPSGRGLWPAFDKSGVL